MSLSPASEPRLDKQLQRKIQLSRWTLLFERLWPRIWAVIGVIGVFIMASLAGLWQAIGTTPHQILLGVFALALLTAVIWAFRVRMPTREEAVRRLELTSGVAHRPASSYEDQLAETTDNPATLALWKAHRARMAQLLARMRVGRPEPRPDRQDPWALRALMMLGGVLLMAMAGDAATDRLAAAFRFGPAITAAEARLDAWVTPPAYTAQPPVMLSDGARGGLITPASEQDQLLAVPEKSVLVVRTSGTSLGQLTVTVTPEGASPQVHEAPRAKSAKDAAEVKLELTETARIDVGVGGTSVAAWTFEVIPDRVPTIALTKDPERSRRGSLKLSYKVADDYGIASAEAKLQKVPTSAGDPATAWAREGILEGPQHLLERPPTLRLNLPRSGGKDGEGLTHLELGTHPWAGLRVRMTLEAADYAGQIGRSAPVEMILPERIFRKPIARAVVEQRRLLVEDSRYRQLVLVALAALTLEPSEFIDDPVAYLGLRSAFHRLDRDRSRAAHNSVIDQLWHVALRLEHGSLSDAERRLRELQDKLSKAIEEGASPEEISRLMQELRQALNEFLEQMMRQAEGQQPMQMPPGMNQNQQTMSQEDLERMMRQIEEMARMGSRESAQQMLSQLRDLLDRLQSGRMARGQMQQNQQMMQMMDQLGSIIGRQQRLQDETFGAQRQQGEGQQGQQGQQGQGQQGQQGQGQQGQGQGQGQPGQLGQLGTRQGQLGNQLRQLQQQLRRFGMRAPEQFSGAEQAMREAERALRNGDLGRATEEQARALEQLRQGAQSMAQQMMQQMPSRFGMTGDAPRDPLGRPPRSQNPDPGTSVKVPDAIDVQRAREILEELRRRLGDQTRPSIELDYIERLLRRF